jgi:hypothetical protein
LASPFLHKVTLEAKKQHKKRQSVGISVLQVNETEVGHFTSAWEKTAKI